MVGKSKKAKCVRFFLVQQGVVSTCNVTERITFVNLFAAVFRKGALEFVWVCKLLGQYSAGTFPKRCGVMIGGFF